jgi:pimeloyl-ACP methyl ester carboxylesterase
MATKRHDIPTADGSKVPVWISGRGRPLLIVHGGTANHEAWEPVRAHLEPHVQVAIMDRRAHFEDPATPLDLESEFHDVAAVARALGDEVDLLGHSSGAVPVLGGALRAPTVRRVVLYEGGVFPDDMRAHLADVAARMEEQHAGDAEAIYEIFRREVVGPMYPDDEAWNSVRDQLVACAMSLPREGAALARLDFPVERLRDLRAPTAFLAGTKTPPDTVRALADTLREVIPNFTILELEGQEHLANWTAPALVADVVRGFLDAA